MVIAFSALNSSGESTLRVTCGIIHTIYELHFLKLFSPNSYKTKKKKKEGKRGGVEGEGEVEKNQKACVESIHLFNPYGKLMRD